MCVCLPVCEGMVVHFYIIPVTFVITRTQVEQTPHIKHILNILSRQPELHQPPFMSDHLKKSSILKYLSAQKCA